MRQFTVRFTDEEAASVEEAATAASTRAAEWLNHVAVAAASQSAAEPSRPTFAEHLDLAGDGRVVGLLVLDERRRPHLLTTWRSPAGTTYPAVLRWDDAAGWTNTSDERTGKETARALMQELEISEGNSEITHHYVFRLVRRAWNRLEEVLYDRIRK